MFFYEVAIGRVQTYFVIRRMSVPFFYSQMPDGGPGRHFLASYDFNLKKAQVICEQFSSPYKLVLVDTLLFNYSGGRFGCVDISKDSAEFTLKAKPIFSTRNNSSLVNFQNESIFLAGGLQCFKKNSEVYEYTIVSDRWS